MFHLPRNGLVLIGRVAEAELQLQDASVSRRHARLTIADGTVHIADLDSHNGTRVNGERVANLRPVASGDVILVGDVALILHRTARPTAGACSLLPAPTLHERAGEELQRALHFQRVCGLLLIQRPSGAHSPEAVAGAVLPLLRPMGAAGWLSDHQLLFILPELPESKLRALETELLRELKPLVPAAAAAAGIASCPFDGCDFDTLIVAARAAVGAGDPAKVRAASEAATDLQMGDRSIVLADPAMLRVFDLLQRLAKSDLPVLIHGETGAGKEHAAYAVHHFSARSAKGPLIAVNCAAIPETLIEAELFGYERGAFSGATQSKPGLFEAASGGTVFLDEIGELSPYAQSKMLRVLETQRITRVGEVREREVNVRVVAATHRDPREEIKQRRFRDDLYFRLSAATVLLPPLRERPLRPPRHDAGTSDAAGALGLQVAGQRARAEKPHGVPGRGRAGAGAVAGASAGALFRPARQRRRGRSRRADASRHSDDHEHRQRRGSPAPTELASALPARAQSGEGKVLGGLTAQAVFVVVGQLIPADRCGEGAIRAPQHPALAVAVDVKSKLLAEVGGGVPAQAAVAQERD